MTNQGKIQSMNTRELAALFAYFSTCDHCVYVEEDCIKKIKSKEIRCEDGIAKWLETKAEA